MTRFHDLVACGFLACFAVVAAGPAWAGDAPSKSGAASKPASRPASAPAAVPAVAAAASREAALAAMPRPEREYILRHFAGGDGKLSDKAWRAAEAFHAELQKTFATGVLLSLRVIRGAELALRAEQNEQEKKIEARLRHVEDPEERQTIFEERRKLLDDYAQRRLRAIQDEEARGEIEYPEVVNTQILRAILVRAGEDGDGKLSPETMNLLRKRYAKFAKGPVDYIVGRYDEKVPLDAEGKPTDIGRVVHYRGVDVEELRQEARAAAAQGQSLPPDREVDRFLIEFFNEFLKEKAE